jgi:hypothetical protein
MKKVVIELIALFVVLVAFQSPAWAYGTGPRERTPDNSPLNLPGPDSITGPGENGSLFGWPRHIYQFPEDPIARLSFIISIMVAIALICFAFFFPICIFRLEREISIKDRLIIGAITLLGLALRIHMGLWAYFHDFNHGYHTASKVLMPFGDLYRAAYGQTFWVTHWFFQSGQISPEKVIFAVNVAFSAFTIIVTALAARRIWRGDRIAWILSTLTIALMPVVIKVASTEITMAIFSFFEMATLYLIVISVQRKSWLLPWLTGLAIYITVQSSDDANLYFLIVIATLLALKPDWGTWRSNRHVVAAAAVVALLILPHVIFVFAHVFPVIQNVHLGYGVNFFAAPIDVWAARISNHIFLDVKMTPPYFPVMAAAGSIYLLITQRRFGLWFLLVFTGLVFIALLKTTTNTDRILYHAHYLPWLAILIGGCIGLARKLPGKIPFRLCVTAMFAGVIAAPVYSYDWINQEDLVQKEYRLELLANKKVPPECTMIIPLTYLETNKDSVFPPVVAFQPTKSSLVDNYISAGEFLADPDTANRRECLVFVRSSTCYAFTLDELGFTAKTSFFDARTQAEQRRFPAGNWEREQCQRMMKEFGAEKIVTTTIKDPEWVNGIIPNKSIEIGYYWIKKPMGNGT